MPPGLRLRDTEVGFQTFYLASALTSCFGDRSHLDTCFMSFKVIARHEIILSKHSLWLMEFVAIGGSEEMLQAPQKGVEVSGSRFYPQPAPALTFAGGWRWGCDSVTAAGRLPHGGRGFCSSGHCVPPLLEPGVHLRE